MGILLGIQKIKIGSSSGGGWKAEAPTGLTATVFSDTRIDLAWTNVDTKGDGVSIERSTDNITYVEIDTVALGIAIYLNIGLTGGTLYYYRVRAFKG